MIQILVFMSKQSVQYGEQVYERLISWDSSIRFPVEETITAMRALYGRKAIVDIKFFGEE